MEQINKTLRTLLKTKERPKRTFPKVPYSKKSRQRPISPTLAGMFQTINWGHFYSKLRSINGLMKNGPIYLKWTDNVEFLFDDENKIIHYSSTPSAKIGFWDWGANKRRAQIIQKQFKE